MYGGIHSWFSRYVRFGSKKKARKFSSSKLCGYDGHRKPNIEFLEDRHMLSAAVGEFELSYGLIATRVDTRAYANDESAEIEHRSVEFVGPSVANVAAVHVVDGTASASAGALMMGEMSTLVGETTPAPEIVTRSLLEVGSEGKPWDHATSSGYAFGDAHGINTFIAPGVVGNLVFHGHLFIAAGHEQTVSGDGFAQPGIEIRVQMDTDVGLFTLVAVTDNNGEWNWYQDFPGVSEDLQGTTQGAFSHHVEFTAPIVDESQLIQFVHSWNSGVTAPNDLGHGEWYALSYGGTAAAAWGYVTLEGQDVPDGDFNYDGMVNDDDFVIWQEGRPQADANKDGQIDEDDYDIWLANTDTFVVSSLVDESDGDYSYASFSLREAIALAADQDHPGLKKIVFAPSIDEILLSGTQLDIVAGNDLEIVGPGADKLTVDAQGNSRVFNIASGANVTISGVTITGGSVGNDSSGGGVHNMGDLTLDSVVLTGNVADRHGGAIWSQGTLRVIDSTFYDNEAGNSGGAIAVYRNIDDALVIERSAFTANQAAGAGAIYMHGSNGTGTATIVNSTFSGNTADEHGGAVRITSVAAPLTIINSTITDNQADVNTTDGISGQGGGIHTGGGSITLLNSIVVGNTAYSAAGDDIHGTLQSSSDYNLLGNDESSQPGSNNVINDSAGLAALGYYGGPTQTYALLATSPAIDKGSNAQAAIGGVALSQDQRGFSRDVDAGTAGPVGGTVDIGAFEFAAPIIVSTLVDEADGNYAAGDLSLREALALANVLNGADRIEFASEVVGTIVLDPALWQQLAFNSSVEIVGPGASQLAIDANGKSSVFSTSYSQGYSVTIRGLTLRGASGAAISMNAGPILNLDAVEITGNGRGVSYIYGSGINISNSTIAENSGTAVSVSFAPASIFNTTISGNETSNTDAAGLLVTFGSAALTSVTITNNRADKNNTSGTSSATGGVHASDGGTITMHNTIVVGNYAGHVDNGIAADLGQATGTYPGTFGSSSSYNLIGSSPSGAFPTGNNNQLGVTAAAVKLTGLGDHGGPTRTHALRQGSIAIDAGDNAKALDLALEYDQREEGYDRIVDWMDDDLAAIVDIGSVELAVQEIYA